MTQPCPAVIGGLGQTRSGLYRVCWISLTKPWRIGFCLPVSGLIYSQPRPLICWRSYRMIFYSCAPATKVPIQWPALTEGAAPSISFATAHSALREVEILHDRFVGAICQRSQVKTGGYYGDGAGYPPVCRRLSALCLAVLKMTTTVIFRFTIADQSRRYHRSRCCRR